MSTGHRPGTVGEVRSAPVQTLAVDGHQLRISNLDKVLYPQTGTTKGDVIAYYRAIAPVILPGLLGRPVTRNRWPNGVDADPFFTKDLDAGTPPWVRRVQITHSGSRGDTVRYPLIETEADLAWMGQAAALELHVPQWRLDPDQLGTTATHRSQWLADRVVIDLDPGPGVGLAECATVARAIRERLGPLGDQITPVTSGSKGLHLYVPMPEPIPTAAASDWARQIADTLVRDMPHLVTATMTKQLRTGKVFLDWSQNNAAKTTIAPYSLRGRTHPMVAAPRTWDELDDPDLQHLTYLQVLERLTTSGRLDRTTDDAGENTSSKPVDEPAPTHQHRTRPPVAVDEPAAANLLPPGTAGPVQVALAKAQDTIPGPRALPGGSVYELKWDGYRCVIVVDHAGARLWSRQGVDLTAKFPDIAAAALRLPPGTVVDGEAVIYNGSRLDFDLLQRRLVNAPARIAELARAHPATFMAFDLLAAAGHDLRPRRWTERRQLLEQLDDWEPPLQLSPTTTDPAEAARWMDQYRPAGIEGIVTKGRDTPYRPGTREWIKTKSRTTHEVIVGGVLGPIDQPDVVVAALYREGKLTMVGRTVPLTPAQAQDLAMHLRPSHSGHPWPDTIASTRWSKNRTKVPLTKVDPSAVVEVSADTGLQAGVWRHPLRYLRYRADLRPYDIDPAGT